MISSLVVHLSADQKSAEAAIAAIQANEAFELGPQCENRLPVVLDADKVAGCNESTQWLLDLSGVIHVDVTFVHLEEEHAGEHNAQPQ